MCEIPEFWNDVFYPEDIIPGLRCDEFYAEVISPEMEEIIKELET